MGLAVSLRLAVAIALPAVNKTWGLHVVSASGQAFVCDNEACQPLKPCMDVHPHVLFGPHI